MRSLKVNILHFGMKHTGGTLVSILHISAARPWAGALCRREHGGEGPALHGCPLSPQMSVQTSWPCASETSPSTATCSPLEVRPAGSPPGRGAPLSGRWAGHPEPGHWEAVSPQTGGSRHPGLVALQECDGSVLPPLCPRLHCAHLRPLLPTGHRAPARSPQLLV